MVEALSAVGGPSGNARSVLAVASGSGMLVMGADCDLRQWIVPVRKPHGGGKFHAEQHLSDTRLGQDARRYIVRRDVPAPHQAGASFIGTAAWPWSDRGRC